MLIRRLDPIADRDLVDRFFLEIADYITLERGEAPSPAVTEEFFTDVPPGCDAAASLRLGLFDAGQLIAVTEMAFGYPEPDSAYIGFLAVSDAARGKGAGAFLLRHLETQARARSASQIFLAVLQANPRGRAFWERQGFTLALANRSVTLGAKTQIAHRLVKPI